ncbi:MAG: tRNA glutamyl-Q(34) synthetase GluQRS [Hyphomicrobiales bacterium]|nr:tRNA glutamyl-Q(34) synthetase GluQRS [Hyphomicrobiales bacterium]MCP5371149.1 tRNA glutamyl-Q(34) synthetase GluQRS [Hyphomicrobiales bacterium]
MDGPVTRFAPSPTGFLHLGHAYSALFAADCAGAHGRFLLRMEDIDLGRCRAEYEQAIYVDLTWLGLDWEQPVRRQSEHMDAYAAALATLGATGLLYPCFCTRKEIQAEVDAMANAPHGPDGALYPGTCRHLDAFERERRITAGDPYAIRLDMARALAQAEAGTGPLTWHDADRGEVAADPGRFGDVVLARKDTPTSYHLAVTLDDHFQDVTLVTRGEDLFEATHVHRLLQALLGLRTPEYHHHGLLRGGDGRRFAKRDRSLTLRALRDAGHSAREVRAMARGEAPLPDADAPKP